MIRMAQAGTSILENLIEVVKIDGKHSFEDTIEDVGVDKQQFGNHLRLLGGIDDDFLCRASKAEIRQRVQHTLYCCLSDGG
jgi:uroporphyrinogen decarboxylase